MRSSLKLFTFRGIDVKVHGSFILILLWAAWQWGQAGGGSLSGALYGVVLILLLFGFVTLHEFGHALTAQYYGIPTYDITLWPFGGLARLARMPRNPVQELVIAMAGPLLNVLAAAGLGGLALTMLGFQGMASTGGLRQVIDSYTLTGLTIQLTLINLSLAVFNMLPAFPMDGGRVLRALLALVLDYRRATGIAAKIGQGLALVMMFYGLLGGSPLLAIIGFFIFGGAGVENAMVHSSHYGRPVARGHFITFSPDGSVYEAYTWPDEGPLTHQEIDRIYRQLHKWPENRPDYPL